MLSRTTLHSAFLPSSKRNQQLLTLLLCSVKVHLPTDGIAADHVVNLRLDVEDGVADHGVVQLPLLSPVLEPVLAHAKIGSSFLVAYPYPVGIYFYDFQIFHTHSIYKQIIPKSNIANMEKAKMITSSSLYQGLLIISILIGSDSYSIGKPYHGLHGGKRDGGE